MPRSPQRLDPVRWRTPRRATLVRAAAVAGLLVLAFGVIYSTPTNAADCPAPTAPTPTATTASPTSDSAVPAGLLGVTVPVADPSVLAVVGPGDRVDLHPGDPGPIIVDVLVLASVPAADLGPPALFLAMTPDQASSVLANPIGAVFRIIVRS